MDFYPSITEALFNKAITWARRYTEINDKDIRTNPFYSTTTESGLSEIRTVHWASSCYILYKDVSEKNIGLYRDDGLALIQTKSGRLSDKARKDFIQTFNDFGLKITAQANQQLTNFLDLTLNLTDSTYKPYRKPNDKPLFINRSSNHPPSIIRQLPLSINRCINTLSCDKQAFDSTAPLYNDALKHSNFNTQLTYNRTPNNPRRNRQRNTIWYNPPFNKNVRTNIAHDFLQLIDKHFPPVN